MFWEPYAALRTNHLPTYASKWIKTCPASAAKSKIHLEPLRILLYKIRTDIRNLRRRALFGGVRTEWENGLRYADQAGPRVRAL